METLQNYKQYLNTEGRATRSEYWGVYLATWLILALVTLLFFVLTLTGAVGITIGSIIMLLTSATLTWAMIATSIRRCRDAGINPWFTLSFLLPYVNFIVFIVFGLLNSDKDTEDGPTN
jgi:uncharacterized membrane protein YhaH (DUF805 family)